MHDINFNNGWENRWITMRIVEIVYEVSTLNKINKIIVHYNLVLFLLNNNLKIFYLYYDGAQEINDF